MSETKRKRIILICLSLVILAAASIYIWKQSIREPIFEIFFFDTPGSPSVLIRTEKDERILINGGANADIVRRVTKVLPFFSRRIDEIVSFNEDAKHSTGLTEILNRYEVGTTTFLTATSSERMYSNMRVQLADQKKGALLFSIDKERLLLIPFNVNALTKGLASSTRPDYLIYPEQTNRPTKPSNNKTKPKPDPLPWVLIANRFSLKELSEIKTTVIDGRFVFEGESSKE